MPPLTSMQAKKAAGREQGSNLHTHTHTHTHIEAFVCVYSCAIHVVWGTSEVSQMCHRV